MHPADRYAYSRYREDMASTSSGEVRRDRMCYGSADSGDLQQSGKRIVDALSRPASLRSQAVKRWNLGFNGIEKFLFTKPNEIVEHDRNRDVLFGYDKGQRGVLISLPRRFHVVRKFGKQTGIHQALSCHIN